MSTKLLKPIHLACIHDEKRPNMRLIQIKNNIATATNGSIVVKIDLQKTSKLTIDQLNFLNGKYIHMDVWAKILDSEVIDFDNDYVSTWKGGVHSMFAYNNPTGEFYSIDTVLLSVKEAGEESKRILGYNPKFISIISKVFETQALFFSPSKGDLGTVCFPSEDCGMWAMLMPLVSTGVNRYMFI